MFGFDALTAAGLLILAGNVAQCTVPKAPEISVTPLSAPIEYEFAYSGAELSRFKTDTVNPYAPGTDTTTGGLRHDRPEIRTEVQMGIAHDPAGGTVCLWYDTINVTIDLSPKIFIASEKQKLPKCRKAIMEHEISHVDVDREVINRFARDIGGSIKHAVDTAGAMGPFNDHTLEEAKARLVAHVTAALESRKLLLYQEMARLQAQVDSLEEYERISKICEEEER